MDGFSQGIPVKLTKKWTKIYREYERLHEESENDLITPRDNTVPIYTRDAKIIKEYHEKIKNHLLDPSISLEVYQPDPNITKRKKKYMRPYFSPQPYSWEIDHLLFHKTATYLMCVNINTRFLYAILVKSKKAVDSQEAIIKLFNKEEKLHHPIKYIRFDGDKGFRSVAQYFNSKYEDKKDKTTFYSESSPYTNHNRIIDRTIRRLRRMAKNDDKMFDGTPKNNAKVQQLVYYYNNFGHHGIDMKAPLEMHGHIDMEWAYIRRKKEELYDQKRKQMEAGMWSYKVGQPLRMYLDPDKTKNKFDKDRHRFKTIGQFVKYRHGNVVAQLLDGKKVEVPIYYAIPDNPYDAKTHPNAKGIKDEKAKCKNALDDEIVGFEIEPQN